jgi:stage V sporulation protein R
VVDANARNRGELLLEHEHHGVDLDAGYARQVLTNLHKVWSRPVAVATTIEGKPVLLSFDGADFSEEERKDA